MVASLDGFLPFCCPALWRNKYCCRYCDKKLARNRSFPRMGGLYILRRLSHHSTGVVNTLRPSKLADNTDRWTLFISCLYHGSL